MVYFSFLFAEDSLLTYLTQTDRAYGARGRCKTIVLNKCATSESPLLIHLARKDQNIAFLVNGNVVLVLLMGFSIFSCCWYCK